MNALRDVDDDAATTVMDRSAVPPQSGTRMSVALSEPPRDTIVDPPSAWSCARAFLGAIVLRIRERFREARLSEHGLRPERVQLHAYPFGNPHHGALPDCCVTFPLDAAA
ncbi:hypothetical protein [Polyangium sp. 15x6]|uniref:hypothetical protein n=1 Tax=Polyangium sp. 15x6 TaxID=3042687 RepID=UPI00249B8A6C|nr:hypothetical protein [Polyangium sp. 15x6]MDI3292132.1 hypothetical protein [Polyangium sp. 15x6]